MIEMVGRKIFALSHKGNGLERGVYLKWIGAQGSPLFYFIEKTILPVKPLGENEGKKIYFRIQEDAEIGVFFQEISPFCPDGETLILINFLPYWEEVDGRWGMADSDPLGSARYIDDAILIPPGGGVRIDGKDYYYSHLPCGRWELVEEGITVEAVIPS